MLTDRKEMGWRSVHIGLLSEVQEGGRTVEEAVFWYNVTKGTHELSPYELVFAATSRKPWTGSCRGEIKRPEADATDCEGGISDGQVDPNRDVELNPFVVGEEVYLRDPLGRCDTEWSGPHRITEVRSAVSVVVNDDGISRHVSHLRFVPGRCPIEGSLRLNDDSDDHPLISDDNAASTEAEDGAGPGPVRRSSRSRQPPAWFPDYVLD